MPLDVEVPDPPSLHGPQPRGDYEAIAEPADGSADDYRREELETFLRDGAWADAFAEWAEHTFVSVEEFETVRRFGLLDRFDFYWDPATDEVGYRAPVLPEEARAAFEDDDADAIDAELDSLGRVVSEVLESDYLLRDEETFGFFADDYTGETPGEESRDEE